MQIGEGTRRHEEEQIKILRRGKSLEGHYILQELGINPADIEAVKLVNNQLESLRRFSLVEETASCLEVDEVMATSSKEDINNSDDLIQRFHDD